MPEIYPEKYGDYPVYEDITIEVMNDCVFIDPRTNIDNVGTFITFDKEHDYGDEHTFSNREEVEKFIKDKNCESFNVYMKEDGHLDISESSQSKYIGVIYSTPSDIRKEFDKDTSETREKVREALRYEIEAVDAFIHDDIYAYEIKTPNGVYEEYHGFYGKKECIEEALLDYDKLCENFTTPEAVENFIKKDRDNYKLLPMECRTLEASKQYLKAGGDVKEIPQKYVKNVIKKVIFSDNSKMSL